MSISSTIRRNDYTGNGSTAEYDFTFRIFVDADLLVTVRDPSTGDETTLVFDDDYTVSGAGDPDGQITLVDNNQDWIDGSGFLDTDWHLTIRRVRPLTQEEDIRNQGDFFPETHEDAFDHFIMVDQQQQDEIDRSIKIPETVAASGF